MDFGPHWFSVREATIRLGYLGDVQILPPHQVVLWDGRLRPAPLALPPDRARQHAKSDIFRLYKMGLLSRRRDHTSRPGRRPFLYRVSPKGRRYLAWLEGPALIRGFQKLVLEGTGPGAVPAAERLLGWLRGFQGDELSDAEFGLLELHVDFLRYYPSDDAHSQACNDFGFACLKAMERAATEIQSKADTVIYPFLLHHTRRLEAKTRRRT